jgi:ERCC4-type nuclease
MLITPTIVVDSREQDPWTFPNLPSEVGTLDTGDYSVRGLEHLISVERKSLSDLLGCIGTHRDRFKRELQRLRGYRFRLLVIEADVATLEAGKWRSKIKPASVLGSLAAWTAQFDLPVWLGGDHETSGNFAEKFLVQSVQTIARVASAVGAMA